MPAPNVPNIASGNTVFSQEMRDFHQWEAGELWTAVDAFFTGRLISTTGTSTTSNTVGTGDKTFTTQAGLGYVVGMPVNVVNTANPANYMSGFVKSYSGTTLVVTVITSGGSGTLTAWSIALGLSGGGASLGANNFTGVQNFNQATDIAAAATTNLDTATGNAVVITGNTGISAWTLSNGRLRYGVITGTPLLTYNATTNNMNSGATNYQCVGGERFIAFASTGVVYLMLTKADGSQISPNPSKIQPITASVGSSALTITLNPTVLDFRSATLTSGTVNTRTVSAAISVVVSSGSTLGTVSATQSRLAVLAIDNAGTVELAVVNLAGGTNLDETGVISTTAEGGAGAADSATVIYSTTARSNVPYRVVGYIESTQATAGTWATAPSTIQGAGGLAMSSLSGIRAWQDLTASRATNTTYTNTNGYEIEITGYLTCTTANNFQVLLNGNVMTFESSVIGGVTPFNLKVPAGNTYLVNPGGANFNLTKWWELR